MTALVGPLGVIVGAVIAILGYRRATRVDKAVEKSAVVAAQSGAIGQVIAGLNLIIDSQRADAMEWRATVAEMRATVRATAGDLAAVVKERDQLREELNDCREAARRARSD